MKKLLTIVLFFLSLVNSVSANNLKNIKFKKQYKQGSKYNAVINYEDDYKNKPNFVNISWFEKIAIQGNADAQFVLGIMYEFGFGVNQDFIIATNWYEKAAIQDDILAQYVIGEMYQHGDGVKQDYLKALDWFNRGSDLIPYYPCYEPYKIEFSVFIPYRRFILGRFDLNYDKIF